MFIEILHENADISVRMLCDYSGKKRGLLNSFCAFADAFLSIFRKLLPVVFFGASENNC